MKYKKPAPIEPPILEELESRILFSAGLEGALLDIPLPSELLLDSHVEEQLVEPRSDKGFTAAAEYLRYELVVVDTATPDYQRLVDDILAQAGEDRHVEVVLLDQDEDGIDQMSEILSYHNGLDAVHLISHGSDGSITLGNSRLDFDSLLSNTPTIKKWGNAIAEQGDLLVYGCNLAASADGQSLVDALGRLTGADVAASDDLTGHESLGGDWDLEYQAGAIEADVVTNAYAQQRWSGILAGFVVDTTADTVDVNLGDGLAQDASGNTSLRAAIMEAKAEVSSTVIRRSLPIRCSTTTRPGVMVAASGLPAPVPA